MLVAERVTRALRPSRLLACFSILFAVRAECEGGSDVAASASAGAAIDDDALLRAVLAAPRPLAAGLASDEEDSREDGAPGAAWGEDPLLGGAPVFSLAHAANASARCRRQSRVFLSELRRHRLWALQMWDAGAKLPSGVLRGNANQLGDFDECVGVDSGALRAWGGERVRGRYCLAEVDVSLAAPAAAAAPAPAPRREAAEAVRAALDMVLAYRFIRSELRDPGHFVPKFTSINWALCVPAACSEGDAQAGVGEQLRRLGAGSGLQLTAAVERGLCYGPAPGPGPGPAPGRSPAAAAAIGLYVALALVTATATLRDRDGKPTPASAGAAERAVMAFSLRRNWAALVATLGAGGDGDIPCIHGVRALFSLSLYVAHKVITLALMPYVNRVELTQAANEPLSSMLRASIVYTDSFLMLSGVLIAYNLSREMSRKGSVKWMKRYVARYVRLTPALVALVLFYGYVFEHLGQGPQWGRVVQQNADICKRNMWRNVLYIQNFFPFEDMCATHTHQLALDMQLSLLAPPLVTLLSKSPIGGAAVLLAINVLSAALRYVSTRDNDLSLVIYHGMPMAQLYKTANMAYEIALYRATPYVMGIALGYYMSKIGKNVYIPKAALAGGWAAAGALAYYALLSRWAEARLDFEYSAAEAAVYAGWSPVAWALALGWLIFACFTGYGGYLNTFLSIKPLVIFSRISYAVYLTQFAVFFYNVGVTRTSEQFTILKGIDPVEFIVVIALSVVMTLIFDFPMQEIKNILLTSDTRSKKSVEQRKNDFNKTL
ncbi:hypothetical protein R5R35_009735 [Gryllus longicercus]|uniref:Nose resistant-to-fluoxetine protein N-terminal domain-containing protein n=1 Tax=Gryllus longicercus TaxID=2509291 RepID=A0AAN9ZEN6_9ORTH